MFLGYYFRMGKVKVKKAATANSRVIKQSSIFNSGAWNDFVSGAGLERVRPDYYYLGEALPRDLTKRTKLGCEKLFTNLFADAILAGAVVLPGQYNYEDFVFKAREGSKFGSRRLVDVWISFQGKATVGWGLCGNREKLFSCPLGSHDIDSTIEHLARHASVALSYVPPGVVMEYPSGLRQWWVNGELHRDGAPAVIDANGGRKWFQHGRYHREDGPAVEEKCGTKEWRLRGQLHRVDGPARERFDGWKEWFRNRKRHRDGAPAVVGPDGHESWYKNGKRHREDGPAVVNADGTPEWWLDGVEVDAQTIEN